jgi:hypothetical protein
MTCSNQSIRRAFSPATQPVAPSPLSTNGASAKCPQLLRTTNFGPVFPTMGGGWTESINKRYLVVTPREISSANRTTCAAAI